MEARGGGADDGGDTAAFRALVTGRSDAGGAGTRAAYAWLRPVLSRIPSQPDHTKRSQASFGEEFYRSAPWTPSGRHFRKV
jgi:hypothetical protein